MSKATNAQIIELAPALVLEQAKSFRHGYRNVIVLKKMTFPNDKVLTIEMTEKQISGRNIHLNIDYEDVLSADSFNRVLLRRNDEKILLVLVTVMTFAMNGKAQSNSDRLSLGVGCLYQKRAGHHPLIRT